MSRLASSVHIEAPPEKVWDVLADFGGVSRFNPSVPTSYSTSPQLEGVGATRHCNLKPMGSVEERIIEWDEGAGYKVDIYDSSKVPPFRRSHADLRIEAEGDGTRFTGTLDYELRHGVVDRLGARAQFAKAWRRFAAGLQSYVETGVEVDHPKSVSVDPVELIAS